MLLCAKARRIDISQDYGDATFPEMQLRCSGYDGAGKDGSEYHQAYGANTLNGSSVSWLHFFECYAHDKYCSATWPVVIACVNIGHDSPLRQEATDILEQAL